MNAIRVLLADDHPFILRGLRDLFDAQEDMAVVGEVTDGSEIVGAVAAQTPDVLVVDYVMPGMNGVDVIQTVALEYPRTRVVVLSMHENVAYVWESFKNGALGYVLKCVEGEELVKAVRKAHAGQRYLSPPLSEDDVEEYASQMQAQPDPRAVLTERELEVLRWVAEGYTSRQIADTLGISRRTVESHRANALAKLGLRNQAELIRYAVQHGLVSSSA